MKHEDLENEVINMLNSLKLNKKDICDLINEYNFTDKELYCIHDFIFYLYTGDYWLFKKEWNKWLEFERNNLD